MKSFDEFKQFFKEEVAGDLEGLEKRRRNMFLQRVRLGLIVAGLIFGHLALIFFGAFTPYSIFITLIFMPLLGFLVYRKLYIDESVPADYKETVVKKMLAFVDDSLSYEAEGFVPYADFEASKLFSPHPDHYTGDDLISGEIEGTPVRFSELIVRTEQAEKLSKRPVWHTLFHGIFLVAELSVTFRGRTFIFPDLSVQKLGYPGNLAQQHEQRWGKYIGINHPNFRRHFVAYTDFLSEGERILTDSLAEKILFLSEKSKADVFLSCIENKIYVAVDMRKEIFKINMAAPLYNPNFVRHFYDEIFYILGLIEDLKLKEVGT